MPWRLLALLGLFALAALVTVYAHSAPIIDASGNGSPQLAAFDPGAKRQAIVLKVVDGDTLDVFVKSWRNTPVEHISVRIFGIDTPEIEKQRAKCPQEITKGQAAKAHMLTLAPVGSVVTLRYRGHDKFFRVDADVLLKGGQSLGQRMLNDGFAQPWLGVGPKPDWCK